MQPTTISDEQGIVITTEFTRTCPCGETVTHSRGQEQPHDCRPIGAQQVRDAWADGYDWARQEELLPLLERLAPYDGLLTVDEDGKQHCAFCGEQRGRHFLTHARACPWDEARKFLGSASPAVSDEPEWE